jgi:integrase
MTKRSHGDGSIDSRSQNSHRLRYRVNGHRHAVTFHGQLSDARREPRRLLRSGDTGEHVAPEKMTIAEWIGHWVKAGAPGRRRKPVGRRTVERYADLLRVHEIGRAHV